MENISYDELFMILEKMDISDIPNFCRQNREMAEFCRTSEGKRIIQRKYQERQEYLKRIQEEKIDEIVNSVPVHILIVTLFNYSNTFQNLRIKNRPDIENYTNLLNNMMMSINNQSPNSDTLYINEIRKILLTHPNLIDPILSRIREKQYNYAGF